MYYIGRKKTDLEMCKLSGFSPGTLRHLELLTLSYQRFFTITFNRPCSRYLSLKNWRKLVVQVIIVEGKTKRKIDIFFLMNFFVLSCKDLMEHGRIENVGSSESSILTFRLKYTCGRYVCFHFILVHDRIEKLICDCLGALLHLFQVQCYRLFPGEVCFLVVRTRSSLEDRKGEVGVKWKR